jgi:hypothetical protein
LFNNAFQPAARMDVRFKVSKIQTAEWFLKVKVGDKELKKAVSKT